jgi:hypothetical protein
MAGVVTCSPPHPPTNAVDIELSAASCSEISSFAANGFLKVLKARLSSQFVDELNYGLERAIRGMYDQEGKRGGGLPDKAVKRVKMALPPPPPYESAPPPPLGFSHNHQNVRTLQIVNVWKASLVFERLVLSSELGGLIASLTGWPSVRVVQDQTWLKPPSSQALAFHRDRGYFMFRSSKPFPPDEDCVNGVRIVTAWIALDDMDEELGPLEYAVGSHRWTKSSHGTNASFFESTDYRHLAHHAARREPQHTQETLTFTSMSGLPRGSMSIHDGDTYHGSGPNKSRTRCRRGVGIHYVRGDVEWDVEEAQKSKIWRPYVSDQQTTKLDDDLFPIVWPPQGKG